MKCALVSMFIGVALVAPVAAANQAQHHQVTESRWPPVDFSGTYVEGSRSGCSLTAGHSPLRALDVVHAKGLVILRELPARRVRLVHIERPESTAQNPRRSGLARWEGEDLVIETVAPVFPMWSEIAITAPSDKLTERFSRVSNHLLYRVWYTPHLGIANGPAELQLTKCRADISRTTDSGGR